jgi:lipopolysaccharide export LptBFGC system permease protein LptF
MTIGSPLNVIAMVVLAMAVLVGKARAWGRVFVRGLGIVVLVLAAVVAFEPGLAPGLGHAASPGGKGGA